MVDMVYPMQIVSVAEIETLFFSGKVSGTNRGFFIISNNSGQLNIFKRAIKKEFNEQILSESPNIRILCGG